jgi:hypothetical protein
MPLTRRALIVSAAAASVMAPLASASLAYSRLAHPRTSLPAGLWRSRSSADLVAFDKQACRTYTCYHNAIALVDESPLEDIETETLAARLEDDGRLELEYWGPVTRLQYDRFSDWPALPRLESGNWVSNPGMTIDAFFEVLAGHFAFARERGIDWTALRAECDTALGRGAVTEDYLFDTLTKALRHLEDGHGSLKGLERQSESRGAESRLFETWKAAGGRPLNGDFMDGLRRDWLNHVQRRILSGAGHLAARGAVAWGRLRSGVGYISLMLCETLSEDEGGHADVVAAERTFDRVLRDLAGVRGIIVDLRFNDGGWDRVSLALASHFTDTAIHAFTKQPVRHGAGLNTQTIEVTPAGSARYTGPVAVLTSDATISAAEVGTLALRALPNTRSFGRPTYGALSDVLSYRLPNGWKGTVSNEIYRAADGHVYEGVGIPPDHLSAAPSASAFWRTLDAQLQDGETWLLAR